MWTKDIGLLINELTFEPFRMFSVHLHLQHLQQPHIVTRVPPVLAAYDSLYCWVTNSNLQLLFIRDHFNFLMFMILILF